MPARYLLKKRLLIPTLFFLILFSTYGIGIGQPSDNISWLTVESEHTRICYQSPSDLNIFNHKIKYRVEGWGLKGLLFSSGPKDTVSSVSKKVDALFERAQQILDMRKKMKKVIINIYQNKKQLHEAYQEIYLSPCRVRAWYEYRSNTVYLNANDIHEGILAHEMAHSIIDHYLLVRPPAATAEILARYVDSHLKK